MVTSPLLKRLATTLFVVWNALIAPGGVVAVCPEHSSGAAMAAMVPMVAPGATDGAASGHAGHGGGEAGSRQHPAPHECSCPGECVGCASVSSMAASPLRAVPLAALVATGEFTSPTQLDGPRRTTVVLPFATAPPVIVTA